MATSPPKSKHMTKQFVWRPKAQRIEDDIRDRQFLLDLQKRIERGEPVWHYYSGRQPEMRAYQEYMGDWKRQEREIPWMTPAQEEEWRRSPEEAEKQAREWLPWIGLGVAFPQATALKGWQLAGKLPPWLGIPAKTVLAPFAGMEKGLSLFGELGKKAVGKLVTKAEEQLSTYLQKLEAHRIARDAGWGEKFYRELALETTGKESMAKMTRAEADKFMSAMVEMGGSKEILSSYEMGLSYQQARARTKTITSELVEYLGRPEKPKEMVLGKAKKTIREKVAEGTDNFLQRTYRLERIFDRIDGYPKTSRYNIVGGKMSQVWWNSMNKAQDRKLGGVGIIIDDFRNMLTKNNINLDKLLARNVNIQGSPLSSGERMGIALHTLNPDNFRHINSRIGNRLPKKFIKEVIESLDSNEKAIMGWALKHWEKDGPKVADAVYKAEGRKMEIVKDYVPIIIKDFDAPIEKQLELEAAYRYTKKWPSAKIKQSMTKKRTHKATQPLEIDFWPMFLGRMPETEHLKAFLPLIKGELQYIYKDPAFKKALINKEGNATYRVLGKWLDDVAATNPLVAKEFSEKVLQGLRVNAVTAVLGWNVVTALKQFPSYMFGAAREGEVNALKGLYLAVTDKKGTDALIKRLSPAIDKRTLEREIAENKILSNVGNRIFDRRNWREWFMFLTLGMDRWVVRSLWRGAYEDGLKKFANENVASKYADKLIRETQPYFGMKDIPEFWRAGEGWRMLTMFQNQLNQYWNFGIHNVMGGWKARQISTAEAIKYVVEGFVIPAMMIGAASRGRIAQDLGEGVKDLAAMGLATIPLAGQFLSSGVRGFRDSQGLITTELLERFQNLAYEASRGEWGKVAMIMPEAAGYAIGIPTSQPSRFFRAMLDLASGETEDFWSLIWGTYAREQATKEEEGFKRTKPSFERPEFERKRPEFKQR